MILQYLNQLERKSPSPKLPRIEVAAAFRSVAAVSERLSLVLARASAYPQPRVLDEALKMLEDLKSGDFSRARQRLEIVQRELGYCDSKDEARRALEILAHLIFLLVKDKAPTQILALCKNVSFILSNAEWLLERYAVGLVFDFFASIEGLLKERISRVDELLEFLHVLSRTRLDPCALAALANDAAILLGLAELEKKGAERFKKKTSEDLAALGRAAKDLAGRSGMGPWDAVLERLESVKVLGEIAKNYFFSDPKDLSLPVPAEREEIAKVRGGAA
ncbi:MAG: hypothetical protein QW650_00305 [Thermofilum sp.]